MAQDVVVRMSAQEAGAYAAWMQQQKAVKDTASEVAKLIKHAQDASGSISDLQTKLGGIATGAGRMGTAASGATLKVGDLTSATDKARGAMGNLFSSSLGRWISLGAAVGTTAVGIHKVIAAIKAVKQEESQTTVTLDEQFRRFATQAQLTGPEFTQAQQVFFHTAQAEAMPVETVVEAAKQLVSSGFSKQEVLRGGGALRELAMAIKATTAEGKDFDVKQASESITQFIMAQVRPEDRALTSDNLRKTLRATQGLYVQRNIQFEDLTDLAKAAPALSGAGIDTITQLAMFTKLRDTLDAEQSATSLRNLVIRMTTAGSSDEKVGALAQMGLRPEDVDLEGEGIETALARMKSGLSKLSPAKATGVLKTLFEERGMLGARTLIENFEQISQYRGEALDPTRFEKAHEWATGGVHAAEQRGEIAKQQARFMGEGAMQHLIAQDLESTIPGASGKLTREAFESAVGTGMSTKKALAHVLGLPAGIAGENASGEIKGYLDRAEQRLSSSAVVRGSVPIAGAGAAKPWDQKAHEASEAQIAKEREADIEAARKKADAEKQSKLVDQGNKAGKLVIASARAEGAKSKTIWDPDEVAALERQYRAEQSAVETAVSSGKIKEFGTSEARELHETWSERMPRGAYREGNAPAGNTLGQWATEMIQILQEIRDQKNDTQTVRVENAGEPQRRARRTKAAQPDMAAGN